MVPKPNAVGRTSAIKVSSNTLGPVPTVPVLTGAQLTPWDACLQAASHREVD
jgi:hypothetical protein